MRVIIMAPRAPQDLLADEEALRFDPSRWSDTEIALPAAWRSQRWRSWDQDAVISGPLRAGTLLRRWPLAVLRPACVARGAQAPTAAPSPHGCDIAACTGPIRPPRCRRPANGSILAPTNPL